MTTINAVGNGLSGVSGSVHFAGTTSPTFVTPVLGTPSSGTLTSCTGLPVSTGISGLGTGVATALAANTNATGGFSTVTTSSSWTPTITFFTPGDLSVSYSGQVGHYIQIGSFYCASFEVIFTPTYSTASGFFFIEGMPAITSSTNFFGSVVFNDANAFTFPSGTTSVVCNLYVLSGTTVVALQCNGSGVTTVEAGASNFSSGTSYIISGSVCYFGP